ncbi:PREDICTED: C-type lectin domain family 1 member B-like [Cyprinodon variegatus]|uniref:C-type lectin domain family 1 member B-like n=1 Tax=Cyprinodon variegatus TaxID=28743 RepID=UPI0007427268|nr:PREDICTED: C-type lectin domain family 1 member B-like [Cyprinodon variegatus]
MKNSLLGQLILLAFISIMASGSRQYFVFNHGLKWNEAKLYCESHYTDLATFITKSDVDSIDLKPYLVWIGLYRHRRWWHWSDGYYRSINWDWSNRNWWGGCAAVHFNNKKVYPVSCETYLMSVCRDRTTNTFVKEAKTWDQASDYCHDHYVDLATFTKDEMNDIFTEFDFPIWIGLKKTGNDHSYNP